MTKVFRQRSADLRLPTTGTYWWSVTGQTIYGTTYNGVRQDCDDFVDARETDNTFYLRRRTTFSPFLNGEQYSGGVVIRRFDRYPIGYRPATMPPEVQYPMPGLEALAMLSQQAAALTNPSAPYVDVPSAIAELKDFPDLYRSLVTSNTGVVRPDLNYRGYKPTWLKVKLGILPKLVMEWGQALLRGMALGNLAWRFCLRPMIGDVQRLLEVQDRIYQRFLYLERLKTGSYVKRRCILGSEQYQKLATSRTTLHSQGATITGYRDVLYQKLHWATMRWKVASASLLPFSVQERFDLAQRLEWGITSAAALRTFWELLPWSWLIDWFVNVSTWIDANDNTILATPTGFNYMCTLSSRTWYRDIVKPSWLALDGPYEEKEVQKHRLVGGNPFLLAPFPTLPVLSNGQWSILGSLAALRGIPADAVGWGRNKLFYKRLNRQKWRWPGK